MTQETRTPVKTLMPIMKVVRLQPNPEGERCYCVMQRMEDEKGAYAGWKHISKGYAHSTSAFAALGRIVQKIVKEYPENN